MVRTMLPPDLEAKAQVAIDPKTHISMYIQSIKKAFNSAEKYEYQGKLEEACILYERCSM
jgi:hypothetical protein